jgi:putative transposase
MLGDGAKTRSGRKRHLLVDTLGVVVKALVHPADIPGRVGARWLLDTLHPTVVTLPRLELIWADAGYLGPLQTWVWETFGWRLQIARATGRTRTVAARRPGATTASSRFPRAPTSLGR